MLTLTRRGRHRRGDPAARGARRAADRRRRRPTGWRWRSSRTRTSARWSAPRRGSPAPGRRRATSPGRSSACVAARGRRPDGRGRRARRGRGDRSARTRPPAPRSPATAPTRSRPCCPPGRSRCMTHCNTGALAASGRGTGARRDRRAGRPPRRCKVLACEARPLLQGARLTVWELRRLGHPARAARRLRRRRADPPRRGARGGHRLRPRRRQRRRGQQGRHLPLALAAHAAGIPFVAAGPSSSVDLALPTGDDDRDRGARRRRGPRARGAATSRARPAATPRSTSRPPSSCGRW